MNENLTITEISQVLGSTPGIARRKMDRAGILKPGGVVDLEDFIEWVEKHLKNNHLKYTACIAFIKRIEERRIK